MTRIPALAVSKSEAVALITRRLVGMIMFGGTTACAMLSVGHAQTVEQVKACSETFVSSFAKIEACSALINAQRLPNGRPIPPKELADIYLHRGNGYQLILDFDRSTEDYQKTLSTYPGISALVYRNNIKSAWQRYLKEIDDDNDTGNWSRHPLDAYWSFD